MPSGTFTITEMTKKHLKPIADKRIVRAITGRGLVELLSLIGQINGAASRGIVPGGFDALYRSQIAATQEYLNENRTADLSQVKCLLHKLIPSEYSDNVEQLHGSPAPQCIININGGRNLIAPNATEAVLSFCAGDAPEEDRRKT